MPFEETDDLTADDGGMPIGCRLVVTAGADADLGRSFSLTKGTAIVGRSDDCELPLTDGRVSRAHLSLALDNGGLAARDLGSRNGTFYLGSRIERARVPHGATIVVGDTTIALLPLTATELEAPSSATSYAELSGESVAMRRLFTTLARLESSDVNVLIVGEAGVGKERIARILHKKSRRAHAPFVAVGSLERDDEEMKNELFGRPGRAGAVEQADQGVLFLEDVDKLSPWAQAALLRVLEHNETRRSNEQVRRRVNLRVIAAAQAAPEGLRDELRQRLAVVTLEIPPLRERAEDVAHIARAIAKVDGKGRELTAPELAHLVSQPWPGNIRQLRTAVLRMLAVGLDDAARASAVASERTVGGGDDASYKEARERIVTSFEAQYVADLLQRHGGNVSAAAREAKISRKHLHELLRRHRIPT